MTAHQDTIVANFLNANGVTGTDRTRIENEARDLMANENRDITADELAGLRNGPHPETPAEREAARKA